MTSGTIGDPLPGPYTLGIGYRRTWSGADGKVTTFAGSQRTKWNNYTCQVDSWNRTTLDLIVSYVDRYYDNSVSYATSNFIPGFGFDTPLVMGSNDQLRLLGRLLEQVKSHDFNLAVNLGQLHQR